MPYPWSADEVVTATDLNAAIAGAGGGTPGGSDGYVQYNDAGSFGGVSSFTFDDTTGRLTIGGDVYFENNALVAADTGTGTNIDHIWHNDSTNSWNFCSDTTYKAAGNSTLIAGSFSGSGASLTSVDATTVNATTVNLSTSVHLTNVDADGSMRVQGNNGYIEIGPKNSSWAHIYTDRNGFYMDKFLSVAGGTTVRGDFESDGHVTTEGPDGGGVIRNWQANADLVMFGTVNMADQEYAVITDGINTYIGAGIGGTVHIRGPNNDSSPQITNNGTNVSISGTCLFTDIDISGTARANEFRADDYGPADDASFTFISDEDTGVYRVTTNQLGLAAGGSAGIVVASGTCITAAPATSSTSGYQYVLRNNTYGTLYRFTSSADLKENIVTFDDSGDIIDDLRPVTFVPRFIPGQPTPDDQDDEFDPTVETDAQRAMREADIQHGFIAEEIATVAGGTLAQYEWTDDGQLKPTGWRWPDMIAVLVAEVKALRQRLTALEAAQ